VFSSGNGKETEGEMTPFESNRDELFPKSSDMERE
jgi:hypothetical protein